MVNFPSSPHAVIYQTELVDEDIHGRVNRHRSGIHMVALHQFKEQHALDQQRVQPVLLQGPQNRTYLQLGCYSTADYTHQSSLQSLYLNVKYISSGHEPSTIMCFHRGQMEKEMPHKIDSNYKTDHLSRL